MYVMIFRQGYRSGTAWLPEKLHSSHGKQLQVSYPHQTVGETSFRTSTEGNNAMDGGISSAVWPVLTETVSMYLNQTTERGVSLTLLGLDLIP